MSRRRRGPPAGKDRKVFVDTGAFVARASPSDQRHGQAVALWERLGSTPLVLVSTTHVLDETLTSLSRRLSYRYAAGWARTHLASRAIRWIEPQASDHERALGWMEKFSDQRVSFTDCLSFVTMKQQRIERAFTFDRHFAMAGFSVFDE